MLAVLNSKPIFSKDGKPVHGRFFVFQKDTNQKASVYTYDTENTLVEAQNPIYTDDFGFPEFEVILEDQIYSIVVEKYVGDYDDPKADQRTSSWDLVNSYYEGFVDDSKQNSGLVYGASSLADADIAQGTVDVVGYWNSFDCGQRTYVWDPESIDLEDGGYVVKSNKQSKGRWILVNDLPYIPSEYYGVIPGKLANMERLTSCPNQVGGSYKVNVPSCIKFASGTYNLTSMLVTNANGRNRSILVDNKTCFGNKHTVMCEGIIVLGEIRKDDDEYIGKLILPACCPAKYSWYPSLDSFLNTSSEVLIVDSYGIDNEIKEDHILSNRFFKFEGGKINWTGSKSITLDDCKIFGERYVFTNGSQRAVWNGFSKNTKFKNMRVSDKNILDDFTPSLENCTLIASDFESSSKFIDYKLANGETEIDLAGGPAIGNITISRHDKVSLINARISGLSTFQVKSLTLRNSEIGKVALGSGAKSLYIYHSNVDDYEQYGELELIEIDNSRFLASWPGIKSKTSSIVATVANTHVESSERSSILESFISSVKAGKLETANSSFSSSVEAYEINASNCAFYANVWPKAKEYDGRWEIRARIGNCSFNNLRNGGTSKGIILKREGSESQVLLNSLCVTNCAFNQTGTTVSGKDFVDGIEVEVFAGHDERYLHDNPTRHRWVWEGNAGNCLQIWEKANMSVEQNNNTYGNFRFLMFGINGSSNSVVPMQLVITPITNITSNVSSYKYYFHSGNFSFSNMYISQYDVNDYFKFRIHNSNWAYNGTFQFELEPLRRYGESNEGV